MNDLGITVKNSLNVDSSINTIVGKHSVCAITSSAVFILNLQTFDVIV